MIQLLGKIPNNVYVAVSGGPDSMAVLDFLNNGKRTVSALYFNHCTEHGYEAKKFVRNYCMSRGIGLLDDRVRTQKPDNESWEEFWRNERYKYFKRHSERPIITGHHLNDVAEWWVFSALNGTPRLIPYRNGNVIRPFLSTPKASFVDWCDRKGVPYVTDPGNFNCKFARSRIRNNIMPEALKINPGLLTVLQKKLRSGFEKENYNES